MERPRRLVITVCPREPGEVDLPVERGARPRRLSATGIVEALRGLVAARGLGDRVTVREGCAGGCGQLGPNVSVAILPMPREGAPPDHVAVGWRTYVYSLPRLDSLATILDENLTSDP